jgi:UDP-2,3-diacylglucosamine pyrophosphatase LpxH
MDKTYKSIFISDIHLGSRGCKADELCHFLKHNTCDNLYLIGDIIDGWRLKRNYYWKQGHSNVIRRVLTAAKRDTKVHYIIGNHDEAIRPFLRYEINLGNIDFSNRQDYTDVKGRQFLVVHGDMFDSMMRHENKLLVNIGDKLYDLLIIINTKFNSIRMALGMEYWSISAYLKKKTKQALAYITRFEDLIAEYCHKNKYEGIICGHIHTADIKMINDVIYMNDGDWVESKTAIVETHDGVWQILEYQTDGSMKVIKEF